MEKTFQISIRYEIERQFLIEAKNVKDARTKVELLMHEQDESFLDFLDGAPTQVLDSEVTEIKQATEKDNDLPEYIPGGEEHFAFRDDFSKEDDSDEDEKELSAEELDEEFDEDLQVSIRESLDDDWDEQE